METVKVIMSLEHENISRPEWAGSLRKEEARWQKYDVSTLSEKRQQRWVFKKRKSKRYSINVHRTFLHGHRRSLTRMKSIALIGCSNKEKITFKSRNCERGLCGWEKARESLV